MYSTRQCKNDCHIYRSKASTKFQIKDKTKGQYKYELAYSSKCSEPTCHQEYLGGLEGELLKD